MAKTFTAMGGHHSKVPATVEWLTPPSLIEALGGWRSIDRDPCTPIEQPYPTAVARWTLMDDGLSKRWDPRERYFLNPPYTADEVELWLAKLAEQGNGIALIFARTETDSFFRFGWERASAALFIRGRINFHVGEAFSVVKTRRTFEVGERMPKNSGAPSVLLAYGEEEAERLSECAIEGQFVPLILARSVVVSLFDVTNGREKSDHVTWRELVVGVLREADGPVMVAAVWKVVRMHPKAAGREHARAKVRQVLQAVGERVDRGQYRLAV